MFGLLEKVFTVAGKATSVAIGYAIDRVAKTANSVDFKTTLDSLDKTFTPIQVEVTCSHKSDDADDYDLEIDLKLFEAALNAGRLARPHIVVRSKRSDINRDLLAERMEVAFCPLISHYEKYVENKKDFILGKQNADDFWNTLGLIVLTLAGPLFGPVAWLVIGLEGWQAFKNIPWFLINGIKSGLYKLFFGSEIDQLDSELERARETLKEMVRRMKIEPLAPQ